MTIPNSDRHGFWVNNNGTPQLIHAAWVNNGGTPTAAKEVWINNEGTPTRVFPPRAYVVELVAVGSFLGGLGCTLVDTTNTTFTSPGNDGWANIGNWNGIWGGVQQAGPKQTTFAFRRWDRYDANGHYDFSQPNKVRRTTATGAAVGLGHGGLWKTLLQTSPYDPNDNRTHSPFVVIEPGSKILCIRLHSCKTYSGGGGEAGSGPMGTIHFVSGNATYFGSQSVGVTLPSFGVNTGTDVPSTQDNPIGLMVNSASNAVAQGFGIVSAHGTRGGFGVSTSSTVLASNTLNNGTWMTTKNYSSTPTSTLYGYDNSSTLGSTTVVTAGTLPALTTGVGGNTNSIGSGHVGWKYITIDADDTSGAAGNSLYNFMMTATNFSANRSIGSTLFLVIPP
jgi:hypothetical protein